MADFQNRFLKGSVTSKSNFNYPLFLRSYFGEKVGKISINAGFSCPNRTGEGKNGCIYCDSLGSGIESGIDIEKQIERQLEKKSKRYKKFLLYFQAFTNTFDSAENLKKRYDIIKKYPEFVGLIIGTRADCIDREKLELINSYTQKYFVSIEYGLQSIDEDVRDFIQRGEDITEFEKAIEMTSEYKKIFIGVHVILGFPQEKENYHIKLANYLNGLGIDGVKIHNLYVSSDSGLADIYKKGDLKLPTEDEFVKAASEFILELSPSTVILRIGGTTHPDKLLSPKMGTVVHKVHNFIMRISSLPLY